MNKKLLGYASIVLSTLLWGTIPVFSKALNASGATSTEVAAMRSYLAAILAFLGLLAFGDLKRFKAKDIPFYIVYGVLAIGGTFLSYSVSISHQSTAVAAVLLYTGPAFVNILNRIFYKIPLTKLKVGAMLLTFAGCILVVNIYDLSGLKSNLIGIIAGVLSGFFYSLTTVIGTKAQSKYSGRMNTWLMLLFAPLVFAFVEPPWSLRAFTGSQWLMFGGLALLGSVLAYTVYLVGIDLGVDGGIASIVATLEIVTATVYSAIAFRDTLTPLQIAGIGVVFAGVVLPILFEGRKEKEGK